MELDPYNECVRFSPRPRAAIFIRFCCRPKAHPLARFVLACNFITCFACCVLYYAEYKRETFLIEYLDANPAARSACTRT